MTPVVLRNTREGLGLTQAQFAAALGVARNTASRWELGESAIPPFVALAIKGLLFTHTAKWPCPCQPCYERRRRLEMHPK